MPETLVRFEQRKREFAILSSMIDRPNPGGGDQKLILLRDGDLELGVIETVFHS